MKTNFLLSMTTLSFLLSGCGAVNQMQLNSASNNAQKEIQDTCSMYLQASPKEVQGWKAANQEIASCKKATETDSIKDKQDMVECKLSAFKRNIRPVSYSKKNFDIFINGLKEDSKGFLNGDENWNTVSHKSSSRFDQYISQNKEGSYYNFASCHNAVLEKEVLPVYQMKSVLIEYMVNVAEFSRKADKQNLPKEDYQIAMQRMWSNFANKEQSTMSAAQAQNTQAWQQALKNAAEIDRATQQAQQAQQANTPQMKTTNCYMMGNTMHCTEF